MTKPAHPARPERMNANAFCVQTMVFAMHVGDDLVIKLPPQRVAELIESSIALPKVVGGRPTKEWANLRPETEKKRARSGGGVPRTTFATGVRNDGSRYIE